MIKDLEKMLAQAKFDYEKVNNMLEGLQRARFVIDETEFNIENRPNKGETP